MTEKKSKTPAAIAQRARTIARLRLIAARQGEVLHGHAAKRPDGLSVEMRNRPRMIANQKKEAARLDGLHHSVVRRPQVLQRDLPGADELPTMSAAPRNPTHNYLAALGRARRGAMATGGASRNTSTSTQGENNACLTV